MTKLIDWLFYISITIFFLWVLGKAFGIIHSPVWLDMLPYFAGGTGLSALFFKAGQTYNRIDTVEGVVKEIKDKTNELTKNTSDIEKKVIKLEENICLREPFLKKLIDGDIGSIYQKTKRK